MNNLNKFSIEKLKNNDIEEWNKFFPILISKVESYIHKSLVARSPEHVRGYVDDVMSEVTMKLWEKLSSGVLDSCEDLVRYACGITKKFIMKAKEGRFGVAPPLSRQNKKLEQLGSHNVHELDLVPTPSVLFRAKETRNFVKLALMQYRQGIESRALIPKLSDKDSPFLQLMFLDMCCEGKNNRGKFSELLKSRYKPHVITRLKQNIIGSLTECLVQNHAREDAAGLIGMEVLQPGEVIPDIWIHNSHGCYSMMPFIRTADPSHKEDIEFFIQSHKNVVECPVCESTIVAIDSARIKSWGDSMRDSIAETNA